MIGLGQEDEIVEITLWLENWWRGAFCHEAMTLWNGHTQLMFAFPDPRVLSFSVVLVPIRIVAAIPLYVIGIGDIGDTLYAGHNADVWIGEVTIRVCSQEPDVFIIIRAC